MRNGIPNLSALQAFEASARLGTFSRAAEELALTHSAVYRQVASLEARLGVQLFTRVRRRIVLTEHGAEYAGRIRHHLDQIEKDTSGLVSRTGMGRSIHIAVVPTLATTWLIPRLAHFGRVHPDITVSLSVRTLPFQFKDQPFDGALYHGDHLWPGTRGTLLFREHELVPICAPGLAQGHRPGRAVMPGLSQAGNRQGDTPQGDTSRADNSRAGISRADPSRAGAPGGVVPESVLPFAGMAHLHLSSRPDAWRLWYGQNGHRFGPQAAGGPRYELFTMVLAAAQAGLGVGLVPRFLAQEALQAGSVVMPDAAVLPVTHGYYFGYPEHAERSEALQIFQDWLQGAAAEDSAAAN